MEDSEEKIHVDIEAERVNIWNVGSEIQIVPKQLYCGTQNHHYYFLILRIIFKELASDI